MTLLILKKHLESGKRNAAYTSSTIQNELIHLASLEIRDSILDDV